MAETLESAVNRLVSANETSIQLINDTIDEKMREIKVGEKTVAGILQENVARKQANHIINSYVEALKNQGKTTKEIEQILGKTNFVFAQNAKEARNLWDSFLRGSISFRELRQSFKSTSDMVGLLSKSFSSFLTPLALFAVAVKTFNFAQELRKAGAGIMGMTGRGPTGMLQLGINQEGLLQATLYGQALGYNIEQTLRLTRDMAALGFATGTNENSMKDSAKAAMISMAAQQRFGLSADSVNKMMINLSLRLNVPADRLGGVFKTLEGIVGRSNTNMEKLVNALLEGSEITTYYGGSMSSTVGMVKLFSKEINAGRFSMQTFTDAQKATIGASTGLLAGLYRRFEKELPPSISGVSAVTGKTMKIEKPGTGAGMWEQAGYMRMFAEMKGIESTMAQIRMFKGMAKQMNLPLTQLGAREVGKQFPGLFPAMGPVSNVSNELFQKFLDESAKKEDYKAIEDAIKKEDGTQQLLDQARKTSLATGSATDILQRVFTGSALTVVNQIEQFTGKVGEKEEKYLAGATLAGRSMEGLIKLRKEGKISSEEYQVKYGTIRDSILKDLTTYHKGRISLSGIEQEYYRKQAGIKTPKEYGGDIRMDGLYPLHAGETVISPKIDRNISSNINISINVPGTGVLTERDLRTRIPDMMIEECKKRNLLRS